jgi:hypothetical protein
MVVAILLPVDVRRGVHGMAFAQKVEPEIGMKFEIRNSKFEGFEALRAYYFPIPGLPMLTGIKHHSPVSNFEFRISNF